MAKKKTARPVGKSKEDRSQSAIEYLMNYGYAVIIISIVLASLYELGIFQNLGGPLVCIGDTGFLCTNPMLGSSGALTINLSSAESYPIQITGLSCNASSGFHAPSYESEYRMLEPQETVGLVFQCPIMNTRLNAPNPVDLWIYYNAIMPSGIQSGQIEEVAKGVVRVNYDSVAWNVTAWTPSSNIIDLLPYGNLKPASGSANALPSGVKTVSTSQWTSFTYGNLVGWAYSTDWHADDVYDLNDGQSLEVSWFPVPLLSADNATCNSIPPYGSHGYTAIGYANMVGSYTFDVWSDDGTEIWYKPVSGSAWTSVYGGAAWKNEAPTEYTQIVSSLAAGVYEIAVDYTDTCDPAGVSVVTISPPPQPTS